ncbi:uncharacterized protein VTP21DRAFT_1884 [Calcarisporiella thermophila]|uniref:uncharacterized protein n=1 Tax=Calcarisporiella thermophila TaxID=911321 RepID=UPI0037434DB3
MFRQILRASRVSSNYTARTYSTQITKSTSTAPAKLTQQQAPNRDSAWSENQARRAEAMSGPRFEGIDMAAQPAPLAAIELIAAEPIRYVDTRIAVCDGGEGALGHPRVYINLDKPGAHACGYCGLKFKLSHDHHHH